MKYQAIRVGSMTGSQVPSMPAGTSGFHRLNISEPQTTRNWSQPPSARKPKTVTSTEPMIRITVCKASV